MIIDAIHKDWCQLQRAVAPEREALLLKSCSPRKKLHGIVTPLVTPLAEDGSLDKESLIRLLNYQIESGVHGIFIFGSSGEGPELTDLQRDQMMEVTSETVAKRVPVIVGVMDNSTERVMERARKVAQYDLDGIVVAPPFYHMNSQDEIMDHFRAIHSAIDLPVYAYDVPVLVKVKISPESIITLAQEGVIAGLKDSSGDYTTLRSIIINTRDLPDFTILTGMELLTDIGILMGTDGGVPGLANVAPAEYVEMYDACMAGEWDRAREIQERLVRLMTLASVGVAGASGSAGALSGFKAALKWKGVLSTCRMMLPMKSLDAEAQKTVREIMVETNFL